MLMAKGGKQIKGRQQRNAMLMEKEPFGGRRNGEKWSGLLPSLAVPRNHATTRANASFLSKKSIGPFTTSPIFLHVFLRVLPC